VAELLASDTNVRWEGDAWSTTDNTTPQQNYKITTLQVLWQCHFFMSTNQQFHGNFSWV